MSGMKETKRPSPNDVNHSKNDSPESKKRFRPDNTTNMFEKLRKEEKKARSAKKALKIQALRLNIISAKLEKNQGMPSEISYENILAKIILQPKYLNLLDWPIDELARVSEKLEEQVDLLKIASFDQSDDKQIVRSLFNMAQTAYSETAKEKLKLVRLRL